MKERTHYGKVFKENAIKLVFERKNVSELVHELGIALFLLYLLRKEFQQKGERCFPGNGIWSLNADVGKIAGQEKRLKEVETEWDMKKSRENSKKIFFVSFFDRSFIKTCITCPLKNRLLKD
jgi:transposase